MQHICTLGVPKYQELNQRLEALRQALENYEKTGSSANRQDFEDQLVAATHQLSDYENWLLTPVMYRDQLLVTSDALVLEGLNQALKQIGKNEIALSSDDNGVMDNFITKLSLNELGLPHDFDLSQLVYLSRLSFFCCSNNPALKAIPKLNQSVGELWCVNIGLEDPLIELPPNLHTFRCSENLELQEPPVGLPRSLKDLELSFNESLRRLPVLYEGLEILECDNNDLLELPEHLPKSLKKFHCSENPRLQKLPNLHEGLESLECDNIGLSSLPDLPSSLLNLSVSNNPQLQGLPTLPNSLTKLVCVNIGLVYLPDNLPNGLRWIDCRGNPLHESARAKLRKLMEHGVFVQSDED